MATIHPTAWIDPRACLADDVVVGPQCIIEGEVTVGGGTKLIAHVYLKGPLRIGEGNRLYPYACLGFEPQDRKFGPDSPSPGVEIGDHNNIREYVTIHRATGSTPTRIGNHNLLMANAHLGHDVVVGDGCTLANGSLVAGHVQIADRAILGGNAVVAQFCRIGRLAMVSGVMGITRDLPPFCMVYQTRYVSSLNVIGLRRAGYRDSIAKLKRAFDILFKEKHTNANAAAQIEAEVGDDALCAEMAQFVRESKRGLCRYLAGEDQ